MQETKDAIVSRIFQKLSAAEKMLNYDKEVSAGIYVYALEELGKLEVLKLGKLEVFSETGEKLRVLSDIQPKIKLTGSIDPVPQYGQYIG